MLIVALIAGVIASTPVGKMSDVCLSAAVEDESAFYDSDQYISSLGSRLAMWSIAIDEWKKSLIIGPGPGDFDDTIREYQKAGKYKRMNVHISVHNIYFLCLMLVLLVFWLCYLIL